MIQVHYLLLADFWRHHPALFYGIAVLLGSSLALYGINIPWFCCFVLIYLLPFCGRYSHYLQVCVRTLLAIGLGVASFSLTHARYLFPEAPLIKEGIADVEITSVVATKTPFGPVWNYKGVLRTFTVDGVIAAKGFPVRMTISQEKQVSRPAVGIRYQFESTLKETVQGGYALSPFKGRPWIPVEHMSHLSEWRFAAKSGVRQHLESSVRDPHINAFLSGIITGEFDDRLLAFDLGRFGLQHLMAISGFHFSILSALFGFFLALLFSRKIAAVVLIALMTGYFLFLGDSPSVTRSWIAIVLGFGAVFVERQSIALNSLGVGLMTVVIVDPLAMQEIGFQFSFGVTASILLLSAPCERLLRKAFTKRHLSEVVQMDRWDQHGYCFLHWLRQALALGAAVNLVALPLTLYHFHKFPWMGLIYNLFFPPLVSISMLLLILAFIAAPLFPYVASQLHLLNEEYTGMLLNFTSHLPKFFDVAVWRTEGVMPEVLFMYLLIVFVLGAYFKQRHSSEQYL
ncbi:MAG: ComEC/Rec2 family competence protein [Parachlamydiaceae bacterium]